MATQKLASDSLDRNNCPSFQGFLQRRVSTQPPAPCDYKVGDIVTVTNGYGIEIPGMRILGFEKKIDPEWRPTCFIFLDWDCYWFAVAQDDLKLERAAQ